MSDVEKRYLELLSRGFIVQFISGVGCTLATLAGVLLLPAFRSWASALIRADSMAPDRWIQALMTPAALVLITASSAIISVAVMLTAYNHLQLRALSRRS